MSCWKHRQANKPLPDLTGLRVEKPPPAEPEAGNSPFEVGLRAWLEEQDAEVEDD